jgi:hypothetical protein
MKNILVALLLVFSSIIFSQSYYSSNAKSNDVDKVLTWLQYIAIIEEGVAIEYDSASLRNNVIEINGLKISEFVFPENLDENIVSFGGLVSQGSQSYAAETLTVKKIKINLKWIEDLLSLSKTGDKKLLASMYKTQSYFEIQELKFPIERILDDPELLSELSYTEASVASRAANYLNNMSMKVEVKAKGKLRADAIMTVDLNDELSLLYSLDSSIDGDSLGYQYFNMLEKIVSPLDEIVRNLEVFISITSDDCPDLYKKDNLDAWFAYDNDE